MMILWSFGSNLDDTAESRSLEASSAFHEFSGPHFFLDMVEKTDKS